ncbi:hypothetical protein SK128_011707, partial [Halocaridina rubra]
MSCELYKRLLTQTSLDLLTSLSAQEMASYGELPYFHISASVPAQEGRASTIAAQLDMPALDGTRKCSCGQHTTAVGKAR